MLQVEIGIELHGVNWCDLLQKIFKMMIGHIM